MGKLYDKIKKKVGQHQQESLYKRISEKKKPQEDFSIEVPTIDMGIKTSTPSVSTLQRESMFAPSPEGVGLRDIVRELPGGVAETGKVIGQSIARAYVATGQTLERALMGEDLGEPFIPEADLEKTLVGEHPVNFESIGREVFSIVGKEDISKKYAIPMGILFAGLDIIPIGGKGLRTTAKTISKLDNVDDIMPVLKGVVKGGDDEVRALAKSFEKVTDSKKIEDVLKKAKETPTIRQVETDPLTEARKAQTEGKSVDEFVEAQGTPVYHGTSKANSLDDLSEDFTGTNLGGKKLAKGIYFTNKYEDAKSYADYARNIKGEKDSTPKVIDAVIDESKLKVIKSNDFITEDIAKSYRERGYSGILKKGIGGSKGFDEYIIFDKKAIQTKSQLKDIWERAKGVVDEVLPKTEDEFLKLPTKQQEGVFAKLPNELQNKIMGISDEIREPSFLEKTAEDIASGKIKISTKTDVKTEAIESLGKGAFMRIFRKDPKLNSLDEITQTIRGETGKDISTSDLLEEISKRIDLRKTFRDEIKFKKAEDLAKAEEPVFTGAREGLELPKSRTPMDEKTIVQRRKSLVRDLRDRFGLTDSELRKISNNQDIRLMTNYGFKRFIDNIGQKAIELADTRQAKAELLDLRNRMSFQRESAYRQTQGFPPISKMTGDQMRKYADALSQYQEGDVFLTKRTLEVVDKTNFKGVRTRREAQERLLQELKKKPEYKDLTLEDLVNNISVSSFDQLRFDSALAEKNPFYGLMVERTHEHMLSGDARFIEVQNKVNNLAIAAKKSRKRGIKGTIKQYLVPQYEELIRYLEAPVVDKQALAQKLTKEEMDYAHFVEQYYSDAYDHLVQIKELYGSRYIDQYFTHTRRKFLEAWNDDGFVRAMREWWTSHKEDQQIANIIDTDTGQILPKSKFFANTLRRTGAIEPSKNLTRVFLQYAKTFERKKMFDQMLPEIEIYTESLTPLNLTPKGLEMDRRLKDFVKRYLNNKKGRRENFGGKIRQNGVADMGIRMGNTFVSLIDLGFNIGASTAALVGEQMMTYQALGKLKYTKAWKRRVWDTGIKRMKDKNANKILKQAEPFIGRNIWTELAEPDKGFGERGLQAIWGLFSQSSVEANKLFLLGSLSKNELKAGKISVEKMTQLRLQAGRWRDMGRDVKSVVGATSVGEAATKYKGWAIPIARTLVDDLAKVSKKIKNKKLGEALKSREAAEIYRATETSAILLMVGSYVISEEKDDTFIGKLKARAYQEAMTVLGGTDPSLFLSTPRLWSFLQTLGGNIKKIVKLEEYQQTGRWGEEGESKGIKGLQRQFTPALFRQFKGVGEQKQRGLTIPKLKSEGGGVKIPELKSQI